jgi:hypothetical protein
LRGRTPLIDDGLMSSQHRQGSVPNWKRIQYADVVFHQLNVSHVWCQWVEGDSWVRGLRGNMGLVGMKQFILSRDWYGAGVGGRAAAWRIFCWQIYKVILAYSQLLLSSARK